MPAKTIKDKDNDPFLLNGLFFQAICYSHLDEFDNSRQAIERMESIVQAMPTFFSTAFLAWTKAILHSTLGERGKADEIFQSLTDSMEKHHLRWHQARLLLNWAELELVGDQPSNTEQIRIRLEKARQLFFALPAQGFVEKVDRLLIANFNELKQAEKTA
jgi:hypothetical protein